MPVPESLFAFASTKAQFRRTALPLSCITPHNNTQAWVSLVERASHFE